MLRVLNFGDLLKVSVMDFKGFDRLWELNVIVKSWGLALSVCEGFSRF